MTKALTEMTRVAIELSAKEKFQLAAILLDSAEATTGSQAEVEAAWETEIQRRIEDFRSGKVKGVPLSEAKRKIEQGLAR